MTPLAITLALAALTAATALCSLLACLAATRIAPRIGFVDRPGGHKSHARVTPYGGGTAMLLAAAIPIAAGALLAQLGLLEALAARWGETARAYAGGMQLRTGPALVLLVGAALLHALGVIDDLRPLGPWPKLIAVALVGVLVAVLADVRLAAALGRPLSIALTVAWIIVIVNAVNFLDNMDGLAAGVVGICLLALVACGLLAGQVLVPALGCVFLGAVVGFWVLNFPPARLFMGDGGSLLLGYQLAVLSIQTTYYQSGEDQPPYTLAMPLVILAVPLYDFASVVLIRLLEGRNPMKGDQRHFSHRLVQRGLSRRLAVLAIYAATAVTALAATLLPGADLRRTLTVLALVALVLAIIAILESPPRRDA